MDNNNTIAEPNSKQEIPWAKPATGSTFNPDYPTEFAKSQIKNAGFGWWAKVDIPANVRLRSVSVSEGTLLRFENEKELLATKWDINQMNDYGIGHKLDTEAIFFLNPGTMMNHADPSRKASVIYKFLEKGVIELWTIREIKKGEEIFNNYGYDFLKCDWYDDFQNRHGNTTVSLVWKLINKTILGS